MKNDVINEIKTFAGGTIFTVINVTKDGRTRKYVCRLGVRKHLSGEKSAERPSKTNLTVFDMKNQNYRLINLRTLKYLKIRGRILINLIK